MTSNPLTTNLKKNCFFFYSFQELYNVYLEYVNRINGTHSNQLKACDLCKQVVKSIDFNEHWQYHVDMERDNHLNRTFPTLNVSGGTTKK